MLTKTLTVALVGNPNTGKTTLFNALSGLRQRVGNYPGVTVEMKKGQFTAGGRGIRPHRPARHLQPRRPQPGRDGGGRSAPRPAGRTKPRPDVVVSIVDASNLERHLYLTTQLLELGVPVVVALNMIDVAAAQGITIDCDRLARQLGVPVVPIQANKGNGLGRTRRRRRARRWPTPAGRRDGPPFPGGVRERGRAPARTNSAPDVPDVPRRAGCCSTSAATPSSWLVERYGDS